jgi:hypothetical protein
MTIMENCTNPDATNASVANAAAMATDVTTLNTMVESNWTSMLAQWECPIWLKMCMINRIKASHRLTNQFLNFFKIWRENKIF